MEWKRKVGGVPSVLSAFVAEGVCLLVYDKVCSAA